MDTLGDTLLRYVIYRCVIGSHAYGLATGESDIDRRGIYLPPAELQWSLQGVPGQIERIAKQECYWEIEKFLRLALNANPTILECLYSPFVEFETELAADLRRERRRFLSARMEQTFMGYARSQFERLDRGRRDGRPMRWKEATHSRGRPCRNCRMSPGQICF